MKFIINLKEYGKIKISLKSDKTQNTLDPINRLNLVKINLPQIKFQSSKNFQIKLFLL